MDMTVQERELCALVLRERADEMDADLHRPLTREDPGDLPNVRCLQSQATAEMRELAHKLEWA